MNSNSKLPFHRPWTLVFLCEEMNIREQISGGWIEEEGVIKNVLNE